MINNPIIFYIASFIIITFTFLSLFSKNVIYSLLCAIMVFFSGAIFFYLLGSEYNAIIQAAVYGFAVPIILGISIMFLTKKREEKKTFSLPYVTLLCCAIFLLSLIYIFMISLSVFPDTFNMQEISQVNSFDVIASFAKGIFMNYVWAFELMSLLLTIIIAGLTMFRRYKN